ncbi:MAG: hypothetical protein ACE14W_00255 [Candidatus Velamenicoccus archaeovorus]
MLAFIHLTKTAGSTINHIMRSSYGLRHCQIEPWTGPPLTPAELRHVRRLYPRLRSIAGHRVTGYVDLEDVETPTYFTMMRDPLRSVASRFQYKVQVAGKGFSFDDWIRSDHIRDPQIRRIAGVEDVSEAVRVIERNNIFVGLTERFDESLLLLKALVADDLDLSYEPVNVAGDRRIADELLTNEETRQLLVDSQKVDLELYDYVEHELFPAYRRAYGPSLEEDVERFRATQSRRFDRRNLTLARLKHYLVYKPSVRLLRKQEAVPVC